MALIQCNDCGGQMSDKARRCPHCGAPNDAQMSEFPIVESKPKKKTGLVIGIGVFVAIIMGALAWWYFSTSADRAQNARVEISPEFVKAVHQYEELYPFSEGLAAVKRDGKYGFINTKGELAIPIQFFGVGGFSEGLACVYDDQRNISFINRKGETVLNTSYKLVSAPYIQQQGINPEGIPNLYLNEAEPVEFVNGICKIPVSVGGEGDFGESKYIDKQGKEVPKPTDSVAKPKPEYVVFSKKDDEGKSRYGLKDAQGKVIIQPIYSYISEPSNGVVNVRKTAYREFRDWQAMRSAQDDGQAISFTIYGYADLNGGSTFTKADDERMKAFEAEQAGLRARYEAEEAERQRYEQEQAELMAQRGPSWLQGTWNYTTSYGDRMAATFNDGTVTLQAFGASNTYNFTYSSGYIDCGEHNPKFKVDENRQVLMTATGEDYTRVSSGVTGNYSASNSRDDNYQKAYNVGVKINEIKAVINKDITELRQLENAPQVTPDMILQVNFLKSDIMAQYGKIMSLAQSINDMETYNEYSAKKRQMSQIFKTLRY